MNFMTSSSRTHLIRLAVTHQCDSGSEPVSYATAPGIRDGVYIYRNRTGTWADFVRTLTDHAAIVSDTKDSAVFIGAPMTGEPDEHGLRARRKGDVGLHTMVTLDIDGIDHDGRPVEGAQDMMGALTGLMGLGVDALGYTTWSDDGSERRYRLVIPLRVHETDEPDEDGYELLARYLMMVAQGGDSLSDPTTTQGYRAMYMPVTRRMDDGTTRTPTVFRLADDDGARDGVLDASATIEALRKDGFFSGAVVTAGHSTHHYDGSHPWVYDLVDGHCTKLHEEFDRLFPPQDAIETFMGGIYRVVTPICDGIDSGRAIFEGSSTGQAGVQYGDRFITSHHGSDPVQGTHDSYDCVALHLWPALSDADRDQAMRDLMAEHVPEVVALYDDRGILIQARREGRIDSTSGDTWYQVSKSGKTPPRIIVDRLAGLICERHHIITDSRTGSVYVYDESRGIWRINDLAAIRGWIHDAITAVDDRMYTPRACEDVLQTIKVRSTADGFEPDTSYVVLADGVYHIPSATFTPGFRYDIRALSAKDFPYGGDVECPAFDEFLQVCVPPYARLLLEQWIGYSLTYDTRWQQMMWITGPGGTGKSTLLSLMDGLLGASASHVALEDMQNLQSPKLVDLIGKTSNLAGDSRFMKLDDAPILKTLTGGDVLQVRQVYSTAISFKNTAKLTFATNRMPDFRDSSGGMARRVRIIDMTYRIDAETDPDLILRNHDLMERLHDDAYMAEEYPAIFRRCIRAYLDAVSMGQLDDNNSLRSLAAGYQMDNDPVRGWWESKFELAPGAEGSRTMTMAQLRKAYNTWAVDNVYLPLTSVRLRQDLQQILGDALRQDAHRQWVVDGVRPLAKAAPTPESAAIDDLLQ